MPGFYCFFFIGSNPDLKSIKKAAADYGVIFAVDEARRASPLYREKLSHSAAAEVDIWLHSAHKSLGALTPGALLHLGRNINSSKIRFWLGALQTSSPPYPVMISLDLIRRQMAIKGEKLFNAAWKWARYLRCDLVKNGFLILSSRMTGKYGLGLDPLYTLLLPGGAAPCGKAGKNTESSRNTCGWLLLAIAGHPRSVYLPTPYQAIYNGQG